MKRVAFAAAALCFALPVFAQDIMISPQERTTIKEYVVKEKVKPAMIKEKVIVGSALPADIELHTAPTTWGANVTKYRYVNWDGHVVLVEPSTRKVVQIID